METRSSSRPSTRADTSSPTDAHRLHGPRTRNLSRDRRRSPCAIDHDHAVSHRTRLCQARTRGPAPKISTDRVGWAPVSCRALPPTTLHGMLPLLLHEARTMSRALDQTACSECGRPSEGGFKMCTRCRKLRREWTAKRRATLWGKCCTICKGRLAKTSNILCAIHLAEQRAKKATSYARRRKHRACVRCGAPALRGKPLCAAHVAAQRGERPKSTRRRAEKRNPPQNANAREVVIRT